MLLSCVFGAACAKSTQPVDALAGPADSPEIARVRAPEPDPSQRLTQGETATPDEALVQLGAELCAAKSDALVDARARYEALDSLAEGLDNAAPPTEFVAQLKALYGHECLAVGRGDNRGLNMEIATGIEARAYWEAGLDMWFRTYLDVADGSDDTVWLLPSRPVVVTRDTRPLDPLAPWMCSADPEDPCAQRVAAWRSRAQRTFELFKYGGSHSTEHCDPDTHDWPQGEEYARWRACERGGLRRHASLPLGGLGSIEDGWIVVYGRRGHYQYCDEVAALDLSSGSHYRFADCAHRPEIAGFAAAAGALPPGIEVETGTISTELLREFAWVALSVAYVEPNVVTERALGRTLPSRVRMARPSTPMSMSGFGSRGSGSSGHTTLGWIWTRASNKSPASGELSWPDGRSDPAKDHAVRLLDFAEQRSVPGCAPKKLPAWILDNLTAERLPKSKYELVDPPSEALVAAMRRQLSRGRCAKKK